MGHITKNSALSLNQNWIRAKFDYECVESEGSINNLNNVAIAPKQIGFSQLDIFAIENKISGDTQKFHKLRTDVVRECPIYGH